MEIEPLLAGDSVRLEAVRSKGQGGCKRWRQARRHCWQEINRKILDVFWRFSGFSGVSVAIWVFAAGAVHPLKQNKCSLWPVHGLLSFFRKDGSK